MVRAAGRPDLGRQRLLQQAMESSGYTCFRKFRFYNWVHRLHGASFADYMAARPSRVRNTIARKQRRLEREHGYEIRLFTEGDVQQAMADYYAVYNASWKARELKSPSLLPGVSISGRFVAVGMRMIWLTLLRKQSFRPVSRLARVLTRQGSPITVAVNC